MQYFEENVTKFLDGNIGTTVRNIQKSLESARM